MTVFRVSNRVPLSTFGSIFEAAAGPRPHLPRLQPEAGAAEGTGEGTQPGSCPSVPTHSL